MASICAVHRRCKSGIGIRFSIRTNPTRKPHLGSGGLFNNTPGSPGRHPATLADKPFGEWNHFRIRQIGDRTSVWLNDKLVVDDAVMENYWDRSKPLPAKGPIMLQTHGGEIRWRNLFVRDIAPDQRKVRIEKDVAYLEPDRPEKADLYLPPTFEPGKKYPGIVIIHGGGWTRRRQRCGPRDQYRYHPRLPRLRLHVDQLCPGQGRLANLPAEHPGVQTGRAMAA